MGDGSPRFAHLDHRRDGPAGDTHDALRGVAMELCTVRDGEAHAALLLGAVPRQVGRAPDNDLVLEHPTVSGHHATVWVEDGRAWVRDRSSRNGTWVNGHRVQASELGPGDRLRLGAVELVCRGAPPRRASGRQAWLLEDLQAGVSYPFRGGRFRVGAAPTADLVLQVSDEEEVALAVHDDGEVWRSTLDDEGPLAVGEVLTVGGRRLRLVAAELEPGATVELAGPPLGYHLEATLTGVTGAEAVLVERASGRRHVVDAENRAVLLYLLARARVEPGVGDDDGWLADDEVAVGIWGRSPSSTVRPVEPRNPPAHVHGRTATSLQNPRPDALSPHSIQP